MFIKNLSSNELSVTELACDGVLVVVPFTEIGTAKRCMTLASRRAGCRGLIVGVHDSRGEGFIALANRVFELSNADFFGYMAQDAYPGRLWLSRALDTMNKTGAGLLGFNDGKWAGSLAGFGLARRSWAIQNYGGPLFNPGYRRHYADAELTILALNDGQYVYNPDAVLVEVDWDKDQKTTDAADRARFLQRASGSFDDRVTNAALINMFS